MLYGPTIKNRPVRVWDLPLGVGEHYVQCHGSLLCAKSAILLTFSIHTIIKCHYSSHCCSRWLGHHGKLVPFEANNLASMQSGIRPRGWV